jgi:hypothetical protein|tara:strand:- start:125 stop:544 length:420 start_codon:yes stop_codon:yes gene_type:complete
MAVQKGNSGVVKIGSTTVAQVTSFSVTEEADMLETTAIGDVARNYTPGLRQISGTVECNMDLADAGQELMEVGDTVSLVLGFDNSASENISGSVIITSANVEMAPDGLATVTFDYQTSLTGSSGTAYTKTMRGDFTPGN